LYWRRLDLQKLKTLGRIRSLATAPPLGWLAGALDVSVSFFVYSGDGFYELSAV
jgi:hypothetical protein